MEAPADNYVDALARLALFADLTHPQLEMLAHSFDEEVFAAGQRVIRQDVTGGGFYVILDGEIVGTWRRAKRVLSIDTWKKLSPPARDAVVAEADTLPLPDPGEGMTVHWN